MFFTQVGHLANGSELSKPANVDVIWATSQQRSGSKGGYAIGTIEQNPGSRHLIKITDKNSLPIWECVTCVSDMDWNSTEPFCYNETVLNDNLWLNYRCEYNNVVFSNNSSYFIQECLGPEIPIVTLARTSSYERLAILDSICGISGFFTSLFGSYEFFGLRAQFA
ncbi:hypothetical protein HUJ04_013036 [Dendroctonus ponderosae]|nr:hypothetical protein HUJ04_013036 [Dendroctonus ponderosae]